MLLAAVLRAVQMTVTQKMTEGKVMDSGLLTTIQLSTVAVIMGILSLFTGIIINPFFLLRRLFGY
ncbi:hypothetical protein QS257_12245 [Terrilactibacillus sp. S3-3]|nr:hypothetical protein QS257_12245 [Terrilactibacillus sp. S3-3]